MEQLKGLDFDFFYNAPAEDGQFTKEDRDYEKSSKLWYTLSVRKIVRKIKLEECWTQNWTNESCWIGWTR